MKKIKIVAPFLASVLALVSLLTPTSAFAAISRVQDMNGIWGVNDNQAGSGNCVSPSSASWSMNFVNSGDLILVTVAYKGVYASQTSSLPTDNFSDTYTFIQEDGVNASSNSSRSIAQFYTVAGNSGTLTVTIPCPPNQGNANELPQVVIHEYTGQSGSPIINVSAHHGSSSSMTDGVWATGTWQSGDSYVGDLMSVNVFSNPTPPTLLFGTTAWNGSCMAGNLKGSICYTFKSLDSSDVNTSFGVFNFGSSILYDKLGVVIR
jgi:hypothetical protein